MRSKSPQQRLSFARNNEELFAAFGGRCIGRWRHRLAMVTPRAVDTVDVLFVDEAAQMSLANVLAVSHAAKTVVLIGDPQQLDQPTQGTHPEGTDGSALNHILGKERTIGRDHGLSWKRLGGCILPFAPIRPSSSTTANYAQEADLNDKSSRMVGLLMDSACTFCLSRTAAIKTVHLRRRKRSASLYARSLPPVRVGWIGRLQSN